MQVTGDNEPGRSFVGKVFDCGCQGSHTGAGKTIRTVIRDKTQNSDVAVESELVQVVFSFVGRFNRMLDKVGLVLLCVSVPLW